MAEIYYSAIRGAYIVSVREQGFWVEIGRSCSLQAAIRRAARYLR